MAAERSQLGGEHDLCPDAAVVERLLAESVADEREGALAAVPEREREHPVAAQQHLASPHTSTPASSTSVSLREAKCTPVRSSSPRSAAKL